MIGYKKFNVSPNATLRVKTENIVATISSKNQNQIDLYVTGLANPFHIPIQDNQNAREIMNIVWEREVDLED